MNLDSLYWSDLDTRFAFLFLPGLSRGSHSHRHLLRKWTLNSGSTGTGECFEGVIPRPSQFTQTIYYSGKFFSCTGLLIGWSIGIFARLK